MKNNGLSDYSIKAVDKSLSHLNRHADLNNPEQIKQFIANKQCSTSYKKSLIWSYTKYCKYYKITWQPPKYKAELKLRRIPTTTHLEMLIANSRRIMSTKLTLSKETGLRPIELCNLKIKDLDLEQNLVYPTTAKHGQPRRLKITNSLKATLENHINTHSLKPNDKLFKGDSQNYGKHYRRHRNKLSERLCKPELRTITLYDFRHYFATRLYQKTKDILLVKQQLGHKRIETTMIYIQLLNIDEEEEYTCKATNNKEEEMKLIENGFQYVKDTDEYSLYRKRK